MCGNGGFRLPQVATVNQRAKVLGTNTPLTGKMPTFTTTRKDLPIGEGTETVKKWVSVDQDIEVLVLHHLGSYSVLSFMVDRVHKNHEDSEDVVFNLDVIMTDSAEQAEKEFSSYSDNFL